MKKDSKKNENSTPDMNGASTPKSDAPTLTGKDLKAAFSAYEKADDAVTATRKALETALENRSKLVEQIATGAGKGPFSFKGLVLTPVCRTNKETGVGRWFFKGPGRSDLIEV